MPVLIVLSGLATLAGCSVSPAMVSGARGTVAVDDNSEVTLAATRADFEELVRAVAHGDTYGVDHIKARGGVFNVLAGSHVLVLEGAFVSSVESSRVRVLDGPNAGAHGWLFASEIHLGLAGDSSPATERHSLTPAERREIENQRLRETNELIRRRYEAQHK